MKATKWLEDCYGKSPDWKTALAIAAHYTMLALRQMETNRGEDATDYLALALQWNSKSANELIEVGRAQVNNPPRRPEERNEPGKPHAANRVR